jgi:O-antigen/teichoic acid export membrane protein
MNLNQIRKLFNSFFKEGHARTIKAKRNVIGSFVIKGINILLGIIILPITLNYLGATKYGIWLTVSSVVEWFMFFDIGLGQGLRNKFAEAKAIQDINEARKYISTTYIVLTFIITAVYLIVLVVTKFINWSSVFNAPAELNGELENLFLIVFTFFCLQFVVKLILTILIADQRPALNDLIQLIVKIFTSIAIVVLSKTTTGSLIYIGWTYSLIPVVILFFASIFYFAKDYRNFIPSLKYYDYKCVHNLFGIGVQFFIMQIAVVIMYATDNMIITQLFTPAEVTPYNIAYKYFGMATMGFSIIVTPIWSATTEAFARREFDWIKKTVNFLQIIWLMLCAGIIIMLIFSNLIYTFWIGDSVKIPFFMSFTMALYAAVLTFGSIYVYIINGIGKVRLQFYTAIASAILNIPLSILFAKYCKLGPSGVMVATIVCTSYGFLLAPIQYKKIITNTARGVWNK